MLPEHRKSLQRQLPDELAFPYFRGREAAWLLGQRLNRPERIATLRRGPLAPLINRPGVRETVRACGDGRLDALRLQPLADPLETFEQRGLPDGGSAAEMAFDALCEADILPLIVTFDAWDGEDGGWRWNQTSRRGTNLVVQVNFPEDYADRFIRLFGEESRRWLEYWSHPVRRDGPITLSWARLDMDPGSDEVLIEEIQTDWLRTMKRHAKPLVQSAGKSKKAEARSLLDETAERYGKIWAEATLLAAMAVARRFLGVRRVWLHQPHTGAKLKHIRDTQPPRSLYSDLPRRFCFQPTDRAPEILYRARSQVVSRLRRAPRPVFWQHDLGAPVA